MKQAPVTVRSSVEVDDVHDRGFVFPGGIVLPGSGASNSKFHKGQLYGLTFGRLDYPRGLDGTAVGEVGGRTCQYPPTVLGPLRMEKEATCWIVLGVFSGVASGKCSRKVQTWTGWHRGKERTDFGKNRFLILADGGRSFHWQ